MVVTFVFTTRGFCVTFPPLGFIRKTGKFRLRAKLDASGSRHSGGVERTGLVPITCLELFFEILVALAKDA